MIQGQTSCGSARIVMPCVQEAINGGGTSSSPGRARALSSGVEPQTGTQGRR